MADDVKVTGEVLSPEVVTGSALSTIQKAEIDVQIATAHQYPRSMQKFQTRALEMVTLDEETAQSCIYRRPVGTKNGRPEYAEGKSIRMAEIVGACYGNLRVASMLVEQTPRYVKARGMAHDLESNFAASSEVVEATVTKDGVPYSERMRLVVAKAALAKARRDATFQVVPAALCKTLEAKAREVAIGTEATLGKRRALVLDWLNKLGVELPRVWAALGIKGPEDIGLEELETLTGIRTAIKDGDVTLEEAFPVGGKSHVVADLNAKFAPKLPEPETVAAPLAPVAEPELGPEPAPEPQLEAPIIEEVTAKSGQRKNGQKWTRYGVKINGTWYGTFDDKVANLASELALSKKPCHFTFTSDGNYKNLETLEAAE
jgi:hypothetical protein